MANDALKVNLNRDILKVTPRKINLSVLAMNGAFRKAWPRFLSASLRLRSSSSAAARAKPDLPIYDAGHRSSVETCRLHGIDPLAFLTDVVPKLVDREASADVSDLLPRQWKAARHCCVSGSGLRRTLTIPPSTGRRDRARFCRKDPGKAYKLTRPGLSASSGY